MTGSFAFMAAAMTVEMVGVCKAAEFLTKRRDENTERYLEQLEINNQPRRLP